MTEFGFARRDVLKSTGLAAATLWGASTARSAQQEFGAGERIWSFETGGPVETNPTVVDGSVYFGSHDAHLYAAAAETGEELWRFETEEPPGDREEDYKAYSGVLSDPVVVEGTVYFGANDHHLYAVDAATGEREWRFDTGNYVWGSPTVADGVVYVTSRSDYVFALDAGTGEELWRGPMESSSGGGVAVVDGRVHAGSYGEVNFRTFDADTGEMLWEKALSSEQCAAPAVHDGTVYTAFSDEPLFAFDAATGEEQWRFSGQLLNNVDFGINEVPTVWDGTVYMTAAYGNPGLYAVDAGTGEQEWYTEIPLMLDQSPTVADGVVFASSYEETSLFAIDARSGEILWRFETHAAVGGAPMVVDGVVFFGTNDGYLHAVGTGLEGSSEDVLPLQGINAHHHAWVGDEEPDLEMVHDGGSYEAVDAGFELPYGDWFGNVPNYEGTVDRRGQDRVVITVGSGGNGQQFDPPATLVDPGTRVVFRWSGRGGGHNTVEENGLWSSEIVDEPGHTFPLRWDTLDTGETSLSEDGVYRYVCTPHRSGGMKGAIVVGDIEPAVADLVDYEVASASVSESSVGVGSRLTVEATVDVAFSGTDGEPVDIALRADGETVATAPLSDPETGSSQQVTLEHAFEEPGEYDLRVADEPAGTVTVGPASAGATATETPEVEEGRAETATGSPTETESSGTPTPTSSPGGDTTADGPQEGAADDATPEATSGSGPGLGVTSALAGLGGVGYLLKRRLGDDRD